MSFQKTLLNKYLRLTEKRQLAKVRDPHAQRRTFERKARLFFRPPRGTSYHDAGLAPNIPAQWVETVDVQSGPLILYFHGGGYIFGSPKTHRAMLAHLSQKTRLTACLPQYRLAPEHPFPTALDDALSAYIAAADRPEGIILGGDSAGGGLALALLAQILQRGLRPPIGVFAFSPFTDATYSGDSFASNAQVDVVLPAHRSRELAQMYLQGADPADPRVSPLFADFTGAPPIWLAAGDTEILLDDSRRLADRLVDQGVDVTCLVEPDLPHVWPIFQNILPEARQTMTELTGWITSLSRL